MTAISSNKVFYMLWKSIQCKISIIWFRGEMQCSLIKRLCAFGLNLLYVALAIFAWVLIMNTSRIVPGVDSESSWVSVMTYAIAHRWQFGKEIILTYGPAMFLMTCSYSKSINTIVIFGDAINKLWIIVMVIWMGKRLSMGRRIIFWIATFCLYVLVNTQCLCFFSVSIAGLMFTKGGRSDRWLLLPTIVYLSMASLTKVNLLTYVIFIVGIVTMYQLWKQRYRDSVLLLISFASCFVLSWLLFGQNILNLPLYLRGSLEMISGYSGAMSLTPEQGVLCLALLSGGLAVLQLLFLFIPLREHLESDQLFMSGMLGVGLILAWKASFVRADDEHVLNFICYVIISSTAAPAFILDNKASYRNWLEGVCVIVIISVSMTNIVRQVPALRTDFYGLIVERTKSAWLEVFHPKLLSKQAEESIFASREAYSLPRIEQTVGQHTIDIFCDSQNVLLLSGLNYKPRPSFVSYSTYTPWLMELDTKFYRSPESPEYVLFKLDAIDGRLPTAQNAALLLLISRDYEPTLTEGNYELLRRKHQLVLEQTQYKLPLQQEGDIHFGEVVQLSSSESLWCQLELRETLKGKMRRLLYQPPELWIEVTCRAKTSMYRLLPDMCTSGFLLNPILLTTRDYTMWLSRQPLDPVASIRFVLVPADTDSFLSQLHYKLSRVTPGDMLN